MDRPTRFAFTWDPYAIDPTIDHSDEEPTLVDFRLEPLADGARLTVTESASTMFSLIAGTRRHE